MSNEIALPVRFAPRQVLAYVIQATAFAPLVGLGSLSLLRMVGVDLPKSLLASLIAIAIVWIVWFLVAACSCGDRDRPHTYRVLNDPAETAAAKLRTMVTTSWGIAMLVVFAMGISRFATVVL